MINIMSVISPPIIIYKFFDNNCLCLFHKSEVKCLPEPSLAGLHSIFYSALEFGYPGSDSPCSQQISDSGRAGVGKLWLEVVSRKSLEVSLLIYSEFIINGGCCWEWDTA